MKSTMKSAKGVSLATVKALWAKFNDLIFEGKLKEPCIRITRARRYFGNCVVRESDAGRRLCICISGPLHSAISNVGGDYQNALSDTLVHEMVHQWQYENGLKNNQHDETFTKWIPVIQEKLGITLQESWTEGTD